MQQALANELARYKLPKRIFVTDALPRNAMGKVQKKDLRESYKQTFAAGAAP
jgi:malonyl-CoA/methylmalonyl-CoA synthetase